ncbi:DMT family transporter [uncultured Adlercreutzia sp.]|uniref:DMT family transporter n=1 Tax=uncultured Adlercreutzia sp. TaxID=875803 RepID=UPI00265D1FC7|nr:DMT family transporter [uncultured Adlercreutzia sp.]
MTVRQAEMLLAAIIAARATSFMFSKILVGTMAPFNILAVRFLIAAGLLIVLFHRRLLKLDRRTLGCGAAMGGVFFASMALEMHALTGASSSTVSFLENTAIVLVPMAAALMARRRPAAPVAAACTVAMIGVGLLTAGGGPGGDTVPGVLFGLGSGAAYSAAILTTARLSQEGDPLTLGIVQVATMGLLALGASLVFEAPVLPTAPAEWGSLAALIVVCTGFGFTLQPVAQSRLSADVAGLLCALSPFVAAVLGAVFLGEAVTPCRLAGMALIAVAMLVASLPRGRAPPGPCGSRGHLPEALQRTSASAVGGPVHSWATVGRGSGDNGALPRAARRGGP